jgi:hypothetical protein
MTLSPRSTTAFDTSMARLAKCAALVQLRDGLVDRIIGPEQVDDLLAVQAPAGRHGEHFHQRCRVPARPATVGNRNAVNRHLESTEQRNVDRRHATGTSRHRAGQIGTMTMNDADRRNNAFAT